MALFGSFYLDKEKDIVVDLSMRGDVLSYTLRTPNHRKGNLITNFARVFALPLSEDKRGLKIIKGTVPSYVDAENQLVYVLRMGGTKVANIYPDGTIERKAQVPAIAKTLMSQTKDYRFGPWETIVKTYIKSENKFRTDLHTHMSANLPADLLIALGVMHQIRYPLYYIKKLDLKVTKKQWDSLMRRRKTAERELGETELSGRYRARRIDDMTFINFADLLLNNQNHAAENIAKIRASLAVLKDGQAVFTNLEKVYLYRYVFTKGEACQQQLSPEAIRRGIKKIPDADIRAACAQMLIDRTHPVYKQNTLFEDKLLWVARHYASKGICYAEISDTSLVKADKAPAVLAQAHRVLPAIYEETGVLLRFLGALRRIPLTIVKDRVIGANEFRENLQVLSAIAEDPYVAGSDFVGEEINDIRELQAVIRELVRLAEKEPGFVIRIHAGENDSLRDNVLNSVRCVKESLARGQKMPHMRIGHGLYTPNLAGKRGRELLSELKKDRVILEFQITSNVRLNNLSTITNHPLRRYLRADVLCVQGTDGGALYGTDSLDEQLTLERLLCVTDKEFRKMRKAEELVIRHGKADFDQKSGRFKRALGNKDVRVYLSGRIKAADDYAALPVERKDVLPANEALRAQIRELPSEKTPVIIAGGSFRQGGASMRTEKKALELIAQLLERCDPEKVFFMVGHSLSGYEKALVDENRGRFEIFAMVPAELTVAQIRKLQKSKVAVRVALEPAAMGSYKSFAYEVFKRRRSLLIAFGGNIACMNLIQEARNGEGKSAIFLYERSRALKAKAASLEGYVTLFQNGRVIEDVLARLKG